MSLLKPTSLYIHYPYCDSHCGYCDFFSMSLIDKKGYRYIDPRIWPLYFKKSAELLNINEDVFETIYIGGGTPSLWKDLEKDLMPYVRLTDDYEFTMELNPKSVIFPSVVNRYSVGVQSLNNEVLKFLGRNHDRSDVFQILKLLRGKNYSIDLMIGLPVPRDIKSELDEILEYNPTHISVYILTLSKEHLWSKLLPEDNKIADEYLSVCDYLKSNGFIHYEVSNFALSGKYCKHNLKYWTGKDYKAIGPSGVGLQNGIRYKWPYDFSLFKQEEVLNKEDQRKELLYTSLRTNLGVSIKKEDFPIVDTWIAKGLAIYQDDKLILTDQGMLVMDFLVVELF